MSTLAMYWLINQLANDQRGEGLQLYRCGSILGYCMLPVVALAALAAFTPAGAATPDRRRRPRAVVRVQSHDAVHALAAAQRGRGWSWRTRACWSTRSSRCSPCTEERAGKPRRASGSTKCVISQTPRHARTRNVFASETSARERNTSPRARRQDGDRVAAVRPAAGGRRSGASRPRRGGRARLRRRSGRCGCTARVCRPASSTSWRRRAGRCARCCRGSSRDRLAWTRRPCGSSSRSARCTTPSARLPGTSRGSRARCARNACVIPTSECGRVVLPRARPPEAVPGGARGGLARARRRARRGLGGGGQAAGRERQPHRGQRRGVRRWGRARAAVRRRDPPHRGPRRRRLDGDRPADGGAQAGRRDERRRDVRSWRRRLR